MIKKTLRYHWDSLLEAQLNYENLMLRMQTWIIKYPKYDFGIELVTGDDRKKFTVIVNIIKHAPQKNRRINSEISS